MNIKEFNQLELQELSEAFDSHVSALIEKDDEKDQFIDEWIEQYELDHEILERPDKLIGSGNSKKKVEVAKLVIPFQKKIVNSATAFLFGRPVKIIKSNPEKEYDDPYDTFTNLWKNLKLDYHNRKLARRLFIETRVAELFYIRIVGEDEAADDPSKKAEKKIGVKLLSRSEGDEIYPVWDDYGDMVAFIRKYEYKSGDETYEKVEIYTDKFNYFCTKDGEWNVKKVANPYGKIPVVWYEQERPEWYDVQTLIDRIEMLLSKNSDANDYFGSPAIVTKGKLKSAPDKGEVGKFFEIEPTVSEGSIEFGDISYLTWDMAPEAIKLEYEILKDLIYSQTSTPDLSFNNVKGIGAISGVAMRFMFWDSILKANDKQEIFGEGLLRRCNILKRMLSVYDVKNNSAVDKLDLSIEFTENLPQNTGELIDMLIAATGGNSIMSRESAVKMNPFVASHEDEMELIKQEDEQINKMPESYGI
jgi:SPP1 family phage portal protein